MYTHTCVRYNSSPGVTPWPVFAVAALPPFLWWGFVISFTFLFIDWGRPCDHRCFLHKSIKPYNTLCYLFSAMYTNLHIAQAQQTLNCNKHIKCTLAFNFFLWGTRTISYIKKKFMSSISTNIWICLTTPYEIHNVASLTWSRSVLV